MTYIWENVYSYDKEFRYHISKHPLCSWSVILQQTWTMLIKDRLKPADSFTYHHGNNHHRGNGEICKCFNKGKMYLWSCRYDHRCAVKCCGKFGHGAHICRLCGKDSDFDNHKHSHGENRDKHDANGHKSGKYSRR